MEFGERLRWMLDQFETRVEAGAVARISPEHLPSYLSGRTGPRFEAIARLAAAKNVSLEWLARGEGPRSLGESEADGLVAITVQPDADTRFGEEDTAPVLFSRAQLKALTSAPDDKLRFVVHRGNSNLPVIRDGDFLLVDTTAARIGEDGLYVFPRDGKFQAKFAETFVNGSVALKSRNPEYGVQMLSPEDAGQLPVFGRARWHGGAI